MRSLSGILLVAAIAAPAHADTPSIRGDVVSATGRWVGGEIVTDVVIRTDDGAEVRVTQLGGRAGGYGQRVFGGPDPLEVGMRATVRAPGGVVTHVDVLDASRLPFVRTGPTEGGSFLYWKSGCVFLTYDEGGTAQIAGDREFEVMDEVIATWNDEVAGCSYLELIAAAREASPPRGVGHDGRNRIIFRDVTWSRPAAGDQTETALPPGAAGLTTVTYVDDPDSSRDGEIVDADIELNGEEFAISDGGTSLGDEPCLSDLANTFSHELGHVMGLDHTCLAPADPPKMDHEGNPVPSCSSTDDPAITEATMFNFQECGETKKATPEDDDVAAICAVYAIADDPGTCEPPDDGVGCCSAGGGAGGSLALSVLVLAAARRRRTRG